MDTDILTVKSERNISVLGTIYSHQYDPFPSRPFSSYCHISENLNMCMDRSILDFYKFIPKRFVRYLTSHEYPLTIRDLLEFDTGKLLKSRNIGVGTIKNIIHFLNNIAVPVDQPDINSRPNFFIGSDIRSYFKSAQVLFSGLGQLKISWFECFLPPRFVKYLQFHPELVYIKQLLDLKTKSLLKEKQIGETTLNEVLKFLSTLPDLNLKVIENSPRIKRSNPYDNKTRIIILEDELFYCYDILEVYSSFITNFYRLLTEKENFIFQKKFGKEKLLGETGTEYHLSRERTRQIISKRIDILKRPLSLFETRFKNYIVQMLPDMNSFIDDKLSLEGIDSAFFANILSYIYPCLPTKANRLTIKMIWNNKSLSDMYSRLMEQEIGLHNCMFRSLCDSMELKHPDDVMSLYRILLCGHGFGFDVKDGVVYVVRNGPAGGEW